MHRKRGIRRGALTPRECARGAPKRHRFDGYEASVPVDGRWW